jgi:acyl-[acyl-carrier-protein]-phospholipid O-acyltransferase/long-chain-fatty-acid--[acyl-carrier-protein] ligase
VLTLLLTIFAVGIGLGSMLCARLLKGEVSARHVPFAAVGISLFLWDFAHACAGSGVPHDVISMLTTPAGWRIAGDLLALTICGGVFSVPLYAVMQDNSAPAFRSRTIAANNVMNALFMVAGAAAAAGLSALRFSPLRVLEITAVANLVAAVVMVRIMPQEVSRVLLRLLFRYAFRVQVTGLEHYAAVGDRVVMVCNHLSYGDAALVSAMLPQSPVFAIHAHQMRRWWVRLITSVVRIFPVDAANPYAVKRMVEAVRDDGHKLMVFPEGRISTTGSLMKVFEGAAVIADKAGARVLPIRIDGPQFSPLGNMANILPMRWFPRLRVTIFPAVDITPRNAETLAPRARRAQAGRALQEVMVQTAFAARDTNKTLFAATLDAASLYGHKLPIAEDTARTPIPYSKVILGAAALGRKLAASGTEGEYVGLMMPNANATLVALLGLSAFNRVPAMLNFSAGADGMLSACCAARVTRVVSSRAFVEKAKLTAVVARMQQDVEFIWLEDVKESIGPRDKLRAAWDAFRPRALPGATASADSPAVVLFTSGSEGVPKGVVLSHRNILANCAQLAAVIDFNPADRVFSALPMFHAFGLVAGTLLPLLSGVRTFLYPSPLHYRIVPALIYDTDATICFGTDTFLNGWAKYANPYDFYRMRYAFAGAEKVREETKKLFAERFGVRVLEGYGATETAPVLAINTAMHSRASTVGKLLPGIEHRVTAVPGVNHGGTLSVRGPNVMLGYMRVSAPGVIEQPRDGWYDTGDIVDIDAEGFVAITGRVKRFAKIAGEMISMPAAEALAASLWPEEQHAVVAVPDARKGEQLLLLTTRRDATPTALLAQARARGLAEIAVPRVVHAVDKVPLLGSGKTDYPAAQKIAEALRMAKAA